MSANGFKPSEIGCLAGLLILCGMGMGVGLLFFIDWLIGFF